MSSSSSFLSWRIMRSESNMRCHSLQEITLNDRLSDSLLTSFYQHSFLLICFLGDSKWILFVRRTCFSLSFMAIKSGHWTKFYSSFFQAVAKQLHRLIAWNVSLYWFPWSQEFVLLFFVTKILLISCLNQAVYEDSCSLSNQPLIVFFSQVPSNTSSRPMRCNQSKTRLWTNLSRELYEQESLKHDVFVVSFVNTSHDPCP